MNRDDQRIVTGRMFARTLSKQAPGVAACVKQLQQTLDRDERQDGDVERQAAGPGASRSSPAQVKPGPKAVIMVRSGKPRSSRRSRTNMTVGALMLP
jgi:hypothetical protein